MSALASLAFLPQRCPIAPEGRELESHGIRHMILGEYRAIFRIRDWGVLVLHVRHGHRRPASRQELGMPPEASDQTPGEITGD
jgi:hypothetical protein